uniref:Cell division cycle 20 n=1 Tax=Artemia sinica TaxID=112780 RepID=A0A0D3RAV0_9CRUS|nr:cell division cycle 20 [Artemia sinica]
MMKKSQENTENQLAARWRKHGEPAATALGFNNSINTSLNISRNVANTAPSKTPNKKGDDGKHKTPSKTPRKSPSRDGITGDRFIPSRIGSQYDIAHALILQENQTDSQLLSPSTLEQQRLIGEVLNCNEMNKIKILSYATKPPAAPEGHVNRLKVLYHNSKTPATVKKTTRHIPQSPDRILDAPDLVDDYYLNLIHWSKNNHLAVALSKQLYIWNAATGDISQIMETDGDEDYICSVNWIKEGNLLAVGTAEGVVQLWDIEASRRLRMMAGHNARVGCLSWNEHILSSGSRSGNIHHHDVRVANHHVATLSGHTQEVCSLFWSPDGRFLASGGNDNLANIWDLTLGHSNVQSLQILNEHQAAVKGLAWCPWQSSLLATGGGTADRTIKFWNTNNGVCINTVDTGSQVSSILWSTEYKELISGHGYANNQLILWKYPAMTKVSELTGHNGRVLYMTMSPDGSTVASGAADETLRLWKCFTVDPTKKKKETASKTVRNVATASLR